MCCRSESGRPVDVLPTANLCGTDSSAAYQASGEMKPVAASAMVGEMPSMATVMRATNNTAMVLRALLFRCIPVSPYPG